MRASRSQQQLPSHSHQSRNDFQTFLVPWRLAELYLQTQSLLPYSVLQVKVTNLFRYDFDSSILSRTRFFHGWTQQWISQSCQKEEPSTFIMRALPCKKVRAVDNMKIPIWPCSDSNAIDPVHAKTVQNEENHQRVHTLRQWQEGRRDRDLKIWVGLVICRIGLIN